MRGDWQIAGLTTLRYADDYVWTWKDADDFAAWIVAILPLLSEADKQHEKARKSLERIIRRITHEVDKGKTAKVGARRAKSAAPRRGSAARAKA